MLMVILILWHRNTNTLDPTQFRVGNRGGPPLETRDYLSLCPFLGARQSSMFDAFDRQQGPYGDALTRTKTKKRWKLASLVLTC